MFEMCKKMFSSVMLLPSTSLFLHRPPRAERLQMHLFSPKDKKKRRRSRSNSADFIALAAVKKNQRLADDDNSYAISGPSMDLPVHAYKKEIVEYVQNNSNNQVLLITAATGSGKSTQIPAFFLNSDHGMAVTQPRRVAAMTLASRVAAELASRTQTNQRVGGQIGYRVRFDDCTSHSNTQLAYVTDGMLLREAMVDPNLKRYSIVFLDEAHERSLQTDILLGVVQRARIQRKDKNPLQVVVMSATLELETFRNFFGADSTHTIEIPGRQFPVQTLYTAKPQDDYMEAALATILQIHENEPKETKDGDILVFLPGQEEIEDLATLLKQQLIAYEQEQKDSEIANTWTGDRVEVLDATNTQSSNLVAGVLICVLYAALPKEAQLAAFNPKPTGCRRKVILATNIAETSVTLPGIRYVVDTGKHKIRQVAPATGMESLLIDTVSQAQASQRSGRAGRIQAGMCFRLYTEEAFDILPKVGIPEILRVNLAQVVLQLQGMGIKDPTTFDFVTPPEKASLVRAMKLLFALKALDKSMQLTSYGEKLAKLPLDPVFGHLLLQSSEYSCVKEMLTVVSVLSADNLFYRPSGEGSLSNKATAAHLRFSSHEGDIPTFLNVYDAWKREALYLPPSSGGRKSQKRHLEAIKNQDRHGKDKLQTHGEWCQKNFISGRAIVKAFNIRKQLEHLCTKPTQQNGLGIDCSLTSGKDRERFLKCVAAGLFLQAASRIKVDSDKNDGKGRSGLVGSSRGRFRTKIESEDVSVHPTSTMFNRQPAPKCVVYTELVVTKKTYIRGVTQIKEEWLHEVAPEFYGL